MKIRILAVTIAIAASALTAAAFAETTSELRKQLHRAVPAARRR